MYLVCYSIDSVTSLIASTTLKEDIHMGNFEPLQLQSMQSTDTKECEIYTYVKYNETEQAYEKMISSSQLFNAYCIMTYK